MTLEQFLLKAKQQAQPVEDTNEQNSENRSSSENDISSKELVYSSDNFEYKSVSFGSNPFIGHEIVWKEKKPVWVMNYYGRVLSDSVQVDEIFSFLDMSRHERQKEGSQKEDFQFAKEQFEYKNKNTGTLEETIGVEMVFHEGKEVFRLDYHGGVTQPEQLSQLQEQDQKQQKKTPQASQEKNPSSKKRKSSTPSQELDADMVKEYSDLQKEIHDYRKEIEHLQHRVNEFSDDHMHQISTNKDERVMMREEDKINRQERKMKKERVKAATHEAFSDLKEGIEKAYHDIKSVMKRGGKDTSDENTGV